MSATIISKLTYKFVTETNATNEVFLLEKDWVSHINFYSRISGIIWSLIIMAWLTCIQVGINRGWVKKHSVVAVMPSMILQIVPLNRCGETNTKYSGLQPTGTIGLLKASNFNSFMYRNGRKLYLLVVWSKYQFNLSAIYNYNGQFYLLVQCSISSS